MYIWSALSRYIDTLEHMHMGIISSFQESYRFCLQPANCAYTNKRMLHYFVNIYTRTTHIVDDARLVSSCFSLPSRARPRLSRLLVSSGVIVYTLQKPVWFPWIGNPSLHTWHDLFHSTYSVQYINKRTCWLAAVFYTTINSTTKLTRSQIQPQHTYTGPWRKGRSQRIGAL